MRLSIDLPATLDELARFVAAAEALAVAVDNLGRLTLDLGTAARTERDLPDPDPIPPVLADLAAAEKAAPVKAPKVAKRANPPRAPKATAERKPTGILADVLHRIAEQGGTWEGSAAELGRTVHPANPASGVATVKNAVKKGYATLTKDGRKVVAVALTRAGYEAIDRVPTAGNPGELSALTDPEPDGTVVPMPEVGPIERRPFDPDAARVGAAAAL